MGKHTPGPLPKIEPYVTAKGGVVILNGPFPLDQAERVRALCEVAPDLLAVAQGLAAWDGTDDHLARLAEQARVAIAKAEER